MSEFDQFAAGFVAPAAMAFAGSKGVFKYTLPDGTHTEIYDAILGPIRVTEEPDNTNNVSLSSLVQIELQTVSVIPKVCSDEIVDSGKVKVQRPGGEIEDWYIDSIASATPSLITMELKRKQRKRGPESRK